MRYAVLKVNYVEDMGDPGHIWGIDVHLLGVYRTLEGAYEGVDKWYDKEIAFLKKSYLADDIQSVLYTYDTIKERCDNPNHADRIRVSQIEYGFMDQSIEVIFIQKIEETKLM